MGKAEEEQNLSSSVGSEALEQNAGNRCGRCWSGGFQKFIEIRCILVLLVSAAVFLSAIFWLPPFLQFADQGNQEIHSQFKGFVNFQFVISNLVFVFSTLVSRGVDLVYFFIFIKMV